MPNTPNPNGRHSWTSESGETPAPVVPSPPQPPVDLSRGTFTLAALGGMAVVLFSMAGGYFGVTGQIAQNNAQIARLSSDLDAGRKRGEVKDERIGRLEREVRDLQNALEKAGDKSKTTAEEVKTFGRKLDGFGDMLLIVCQNNIRPGIKCRLRPSGDD